MMLRQPYLGMVVLAIIVSGFSLIIWALGVFIPKPDGFVGSSRCQMCHQSIHAEWSHSEHTKMMRLVNIDTVAADFDSNDMLFYPNEAVWVIGHKWEQQFMGVEEEHETLLPGRWLVEQEKWDSRNWDGMEAPEPRIRCHGCHTVGLEAQTGKFVEPGIGCESCHGKGKWHIATFGAGQIPSGLDADTCGQCHSRGRTPDKNFYFPVGYKPLESLADYFDFDEPDFLQNSSTWWGNGSERKRHQEYNAWKRDGHVNSLRSLKRDYDGRYGDVDNACLACHEAEHAVYGDGARTNVENAEHGITCSVCHNVHGELTSIRTQCQACHSEGAYHHKNATQEAHMPCPDWAGVTCVNCHMPLTVKNGGDFTLHSHVPGIVQPITTNRFGVPNSCQNGGCHDGVSPEMMQNKFDLFYKP